MRTLNKILAILVGVVFTTSFLLRMITPATPEDIKQVRWDPAVKGLVDNIADDFSVEVTLCLSYKKFWNVAYINDYRFPKILDSGHTYNASRPCPDGYPISWHNHPRHGLRDSGVRNFVLNNTALPLVSGQQLVYLSAPDIRFARHHARHMMIVASGSDNWAWWTQEQIEEGDKDFMHPVEGQHVKSWR